MRRLLRLCFNVFTCASLVLAVLIAVLWVRSFWTADMIVLNGSRWERTHHVAISRYAMSVRGQVLLTEEIYPDEYSPEMGDLAHLERPTTMRLEAAWASDHHNDPGYMGFSFYQVKVAGGVATSIWIPFWVVLLITSAVPAIRLFIRARHVDRLSRGDRCPACGYVVPFARDHCPRCGAVAIHPAHAN